MDSLKGQIFLPIPAAMLHLSPQTKAYGHKHNFCLQEEPCWPLALERGVFVLADRTKEAASGHPFSLESNCSQSQGGCPSAGQMARTPPSEPTTNTQGVGAGDFQENSRLAISSSCLSRVAGRPAAWVKINTTSCLS